MGILVVLLFAVFSAIEARPETIAVCSAGSISDEEVQAWVESGIGRTKDCLTAVEEIAVAKLLAQSARGQGIDQDPVVARKLKMLDAMAWREAAREAIEDAATPPSAEEIAAMVESRGAAFERPARVRLGWILRRADPADTAAMNEAQALLKGAREQIIDRTLSFEKAARLYSQSESRFRDGIAGSVAATDVSPEVAEIIFALSEGEISQVIPSSTGQNLFKVDRHIAASNSTTSEKSEHARKLLMKRKRNDSWEGFREGVNKKADPVIILENIDAEDPNATVLQLATGEHLSAAQTRDLARLTTEKATRRLTEMAFLMRLPDVAEKLGFKPDASTRIEYDLRRTRRLATEFMNQIQDEEVEKPTNEEIEAEWLKDRPKYRSQDRFRIWRARIDWTPDALVLANRLALALLKSDSDKTEVEGFETTDGWFDNQDLNQMGSAAARAVRASEDSAVLGPFRQRHDLWVIRRLEHDEGARQPLDEVSTRISRDLESSEREAVFKRVYNEQVAAGKFKILNQPTCTSGSTEPIRPIISPD